jgi:hypothetical protein
VGSAEQGGRDLQIGADDAVVGVYPRERVVVAGLPGLLVGLGEDLPDGDLEACWATDGASW